MPEEEHLPRRFGRYVLFDQIGKGGMARIYLGRAETELGGERSIVIKQILPALSESSEFSQLLIDEAKLAARLSHGNVVQVIELGREASQLYIAMEYVEGFDLRELLRHCARHDIALPVEFALLVIGEVLRALDYAHRKRDELGQPLRIVHRDVSPSNVLLSFEGEVKLCDFGIARAIGIGSQLSEAAIRGKSRYMSPEAASGRALDARSDLFSVGIILWELLSGQRLYRAENGKPPSLQTVARAEIPALPDVGYPDQERLYAIVYKALAKDRDERFGSAREFLREFESYIASVRLMVSPLRFGEWLMTHFGSEIVKTRREREVVARRAELSHSAPPSSASLSAAARPPSAPPGPPRTPAELPAPPSRSLPPLEIPPLEPPPASLALAAQGEYGSRRSKSALFIVSIICLLLAGWLISAYLMH